MNVDDKLAKEKLARICENSGTWLTGGKVNQPATNYAKAEGKYLAELIRNTDLTDCQRNEPITVFDTCPEHDGMAYTFEATYQPPIIKVCPICNKKPKTKMDITPAPDQGSVPAVHDRGCALFIDAVNPCDCRLADQGSVATDMRDMIADWYESTGWCLDDVAAAIRALPDQKD